MIPQDSDNVFNITMTLPHVPPSTPRNQAPSQTPSQTSTNQNKVTKFSYLNQIQFQSQARPESRRSSRHKIPEKPRSTTVNNNDNDERSQK